MVIVEQPLALPGSDKYTSVIREEPGEKEHFSHFVKHKGSEKKAAHKKNYEKRNTATIRSCT